MSLFPFMMLIRQRILQTINISDVPAEIENTRKLPRGHKGKMKYYRYRPQNVENTKGASPKRNQRHFHHYYLYALTAFIF